MVLAPSRRLCGRDLPLSPAPGMAPKGDHLPVLDGVRGLAIILVMVRHLSLVGWMSGSRAPVDRAVVAVAGAGWVGVDLFFVLSGFLITGILLRERDRPAPIAEKAGRFYWRRVLRIFPLYYAACAVLFFVVPHLPYFRVQPEIETLQAHEGWYWAYGVNLLEVLRGPTSVPFNTGHFWSLAVEEQFYLVWPLLVLGLPRRSLRWIVGGALLLGPAIRWGLLLTLPATTGATAAYVLSPARVDVLGMGAFLALLYHERSGAWEAARRAAPWVAGAMLAAFVGLAIARGGPGSSDPWMEGAGYSVVATGMGALLVLALTAPVGASPVHRLFTSPVFRTFGTYAYCLYVVHYPLFVVLELVWAHLPVVPVAGSFLPVWSLYGAMLVALSLGIASSSWRWFEGPILAWKERPPFRFLKAARGTT